MTVLKTLLYFSIFDYPLTKEEIFKYSNSQQIGETNAEINYLLKEKVVFQFGDYFSIANNTKSITKRELGNQKAKAIMPKAEKVSRLISKFPYVESVSISGALSKGYYDDVSGDFDFFIITKHNRLWICRTLLILYKKIFLLNSKKYFCVNYFIGSNQLEISEKNRFTATELVTLLPLSGKETFRKFIMVNNWTKEYFPNVEQKDFEKIAHVKKPIISTYTESFFNIKIGNYFDEFFRKITLNKWKRSFGYLDEEDFKIALKSTKNVSKHHPRNYQNKVITQLNLEYETTIKKHNLQIPKQHA